MRCYSSGEAIYIKSYRVWVLCRYRATGRGGCSHCTVWGMVLVSRGKLYASTKAGNTLKHAQVHAKLNCLGTPVWTAQTTWGICSKHAHALRRPDPIVVGPSKWALFCVCSVWTAFLLFLLPRQRTGVFYVTLNKILLSSTHIGLTMHVHHTHTFTIIFRLTPHQTAVRICVCQSVFLAWDENEWHQLNKTCLVQQSWQFAMDEEIILAVHQFLQSNLIEKFHETIMEKIGRTYAEMFTVSWPLLWKRICPKCWFWFEIETILTLVIFFLHLYSLEVDTYAYTFFAIWLRHFIVETLFWALLSHIETRNTSAFAEFRYNALCVYMTCHLSFIGTTHVSFF